MDTTALSRIEVVALVVGGVKDRPEQRGSDIIPMVSRASHLDTVALSGMECVAPL